MRDQQSDNDVTMAQISFTKMHGLGNDYIYVNTMLFPIENPGFLSQQWSDRHLGIGSDGLILIGASDKADFSMRIFNRDGSEALMCGNGTRCVGKYVHDKGLTDKSVFTLDTRSGIKTIKLTLDGKGDVTFVTVGMGAAHPLHVIRDGKPQVLIGEKLSFGGQTYMATAIDVGNPHLVLFVHDTRPTDIESIGSKLEVSPMFPHGANIEFAQILDRKHICMRVWERGSGITQACGTGACATAVAAAMAGYTDSRSCEILMDGGTLAVTWNPVTSEVEMTGTATTVFEGTIHV